MSEDKKEVAKKENTELAKAAPGRGFEEGVDQEELIIPRAKLLQALSPELEDNPELKAGVIINSVTGEVLPSVFVPVFKFTQFIRFNPRESKAPGFNPDFGPGALVWRTNDPNDPRVIAETKFSDNGEKPLATRFLNFFSYFEGCEMPVIISFSNTSFKAGKRLMSLAKFRGGDMFSKQYELASKKESNDKGTFYTLTVKPTGEAKESSIQTAERWWAEYGKKSADLQVHEDEGGETETGSRPF
ncbi:hypothetical protein IIB34_06740 [PVC group bacterium]|nr:hypothetical protein [PVC group bacterium]